VAKALFCANGNHCLYSAIISVMAQAGLYVPCDEAVLGVFDQIFSRIGSSDDLSANQSTFMVEMNETAHILNNATARSFIIMDEVGRGTSTSDGVALALSILKHIRNVNQSLCIFATHYHELAKLIEKYQIPSVAFYQTSCHFDSKEELTCLYHIIPGVMNKSHGIQIAKIAGIPKTVIEDAKAFYLDQ
jgi:DNA mismatch repair protein MutS